MDDEYLVQLLAVTQQELRDSAKSHKHGNSISEPRLLEKKELINDLIAARAELATLRARCQPQNGEPTVEEVRIVANGKHFPFMVGAIARALLRRMEEEA